MQTGGGSAIGKKGQPCASIVRARGENPNFADGRGISILSTRSPNNNSPCHAVAEGEGGGQARGRLAAKEMPIGTTAEKGEGLPWRRGDEKPSGTKEKKKKKKE